VGLFASTSKHESSSAQGKKKARQVSVPDRAYFFAPVDIRFVRLPNEIRTEMVMSEQNLEVLSQRLLEFARERDWEQFHAPKNLAMALAVEAAEIMEHFQWMSETQSNQLSDEKRREVAFEVADVFIFTLRLAQRLNINLAEVVEEKININAKKYPADKVRGSAKKYTEY
jgi:NTP pyrophosphatase (non-canonical NTP hydrolase)